MTPVQSCEVRLVRMESFKNSSPLAPLSTENPNSNVKLDNDDDRDEAIPPTPPSNRRYRTRSSMNGTNDIHCQTRTRPVREKAMPAPPRPKPSFIKYKGKVEYHTELHDIAHMSHQLL